MPHASRFPTSLLHLPPRTLRTLWPLGKRCSRGGSVSDSLHTLHNNFIAGHKCVFLLLSPSRNKAKQTENPPLSKQLNAPDPAAGKGREELERKGRRGWITPKLFLSCSSGWAETTKYRTYQSRWTRKKTWAPGFSEQAVNEAHSCSLAQEAPLKTLQLACTRFDWINIQLTAASFLDMVSR